MKKSLRLVVISLLALSMLIMSGCLYGTYQIADPVGQNNLHYAYYYAYAGYFSASDKALADTNDIPTKIMSATVMYGLLDQLDLQVGYIGSSLGAGLKYSPDFNIPLRFALLGSIYTDIKTILIYPKIGGIASYHLNNNLTLSLGSQFYLKTDSTSNYNGEVFASLDIKRPNVFNYKIPDFFVNLLIPKAFQLNISYPINEPEKRLYLGVSLRHELDFNWDKSSKSI